MNLPLHSLLSSQLPGARTHRLLTPASPCAASCCGWCRLSERRMLDAGRLLDVRQTQRAGQMGLTHQLMQHVGEGGGTAG